MGMGDIIFDNMIAMIKELVQNERCNRINNREKIIHMLATMVKTLNDLDWGSNIRFEEAIKTAITLWDDAYNEFKFEAHASEDSQDHYDHDLDLSETITEE